MKNFIQKIYILKVIPKLLWWMDLVQEGAKGQTRHLFITRYIFLFYLSSLSLSHFLSFSHSLSLFPKLPFFLLLCISIPTFSSSSALIHSSYSIFNSMSFKFCTSNFKGCFLSHSCPKLVYQVKSRVKKHYVDKVTKTSSMWIEAR